MNDTQQRPKHPHLLLNIVIIVLETFFSFLLKHDATLRLHAQKLIDQNATIRINSYIPFFDFYIQFTEKGLLFDMQALDRNIDLEVNSTLIDLIKIFVFNNQRRITNMRIVGDQVLTEQFIALIPHLTLSSILTNWKHWFHLFDQEKKSTLSQQHISPLLEKIEQQRSEINSLLVEVKQYQNRIQRLQKRQRFINIGFTLFIFICVVFFVYNTWIQ